MRRILIGILIGMAICAVPAVALRTSTPPNISEWNTNTFTQLNDYLLALWHITNGRIQLDVVTTTPKNNRKGVKGEMVLFDTATDKLCVNVNSTISGWSCADLTAL